MHQRYWNKTQSVILPFAVCALAYAGLAAQTAPSPDQGATPSVGYPATLTGLILPAPRVVVTSHATPHTSPVARPRPAPGPLAPVPRLKNESFFAEK